MMFKVFWRKLQKISFFIGNLITDIFLFIFYFSVFTVFALLFKFFTDPFGLKNKNSNWLIKKSNPESLKDFKNE